MANRCSICNHKDVAKIDAALVIEGADQRFIATQFNVSQSAVSRHFRNGHVADKIIRTDEGKKALASTSLIDELQDAQARANGIYTCEKGKSNRTAIDAISLEVKIMEVKAKLAGQIETGNKVIINISGDDSEL